MFCRTERLGKADVDTGERISSLDRGLEILLLLGYEGREMGVTEIARALGVWKSTVHRTLTTLVARGFVQKENGDRYYLGVKLFTLGMRWRERAGLVPLARPSMEKLARQVGETVHLAVLDADPRAQHSVVVVDKVESDHVLGVTPRVGFGSAAHCSGVGKALLAFSPPGVVTALLQARGLPRRTPHTITDEETLREELALIRERGYAIDNEEMEVGLSCVAAPVFDAHHRVLAAVSVSGPAVRMAGCFPQLAEAVREAAAQISSRLG